MVLLDMDGQFLSNQKFVNYECTPFSIVRKIAARSRLSLACTFSGGEAAERPGARAPRAGRESEGQRTGLARARFGAATGSAARSARAREVNWSATCRTPRRP